MKKLLSLLFIGIIVLVGCGNSTDGTTDGDVKQAKTLDEAYANLEGKTITVASSAMGRDNPNSEKAEQNHAEGQDSDARKQFLADFQEEYGVTIEYVDLDGSAQVETVTQSVLAGDPVADVVRVNSGNYETLVRTGMLEDISNVSDLLAESGDVESWPLELGNILGGHYAIGADPAPKPELLAFDVDLLEKAGMEETPLDLWQNGEWTWTNAREYFLDVQSGLDGDYTVWGDYPTYITNYGIASAGVVAAEQDGTINYTDPAVYEAMEYYKGLYDDGILQFYFDENGDRDYAQAEEAWTSGQSVFFSLQRYKTKTIAETGKRFGLVPYPTKDDLNVDDIQWPSTAGDVYVVPKGTKDIDSAALVALYQHNLMPITDGSYVRTAESDDEELATRDLALDGNIEVLTYMREHSVYDPSAAFLSEGDDAFSPTDAVTDYLVNGASLTSAMENGQKELEANVKAAKANQNQSAADLAEIGSDK